MLRFQFLGEPKVLVKEEEINKEISSKGVGILAYLVSHRGQRVSRDRIASIFWNESTRQSSKYNFRYTLWSIKKALKDRGIKEEIILTPDKESCSFAEKGPWKSDTVQLEKVIETIRNEGASLAHYKDIIHLYGGEFLKDIPLRGNPELDDWIIYERERLQKLYFDGLTLLAQYFSHIGQYAKGITCLQKLLYINPLQEQLHKQLMELYYLKGDRVKALQQYEKCVEVLRSELNISPMEDMKELYHSIKTQQEEGKGYTSSKVIYNNINYFVMAEIIEKVVGVYPEALGELPNGILWELSKLVPSLEKYPQAAPMYYQSQEIEKLRIFKGTAELLEKAQALGELPAIEIKGEVDNASSQFLKYISVNHANLQITIKKNT
ncbi:DNA-binding transcriptional activator of the SARP family [Natronincola peptidivorans]|uniref:DNA-binding transcriptional activator of the SARP family n=1 Tax=Natronincola peptidivorans TaxID=426128 RepID=A0A1H9ZMK6_9FIRM|nr:BTAD domain-containing putative transcriptional regulator [Natronincola peptidivorans]SES82907.1 DNA-binding transcriptional activator of the SARP family [Natronincola peptidivorans]